MPRRYSTAEEDTSKQPGKRDYDYIATMRQRYSDAKAGWSTIRRDFREDVRYVSGEPADQWDPLIKNSRDDDGIPALTLDSLNPLINQIVNQSRTDRPQPKVAPGDGGQPGTADAIEGKMRHILYESHADVAFDTAQMYCASGGFGFYRITKEWVGGSVRTTSGGGKARMTFVQEPRVKRIQDPLTVLVDPEVQELDYSDMRWCFVPKRYDREDFRRTFKVEPVPFPFDDDKENDWGDETKAVVAEYWWIENIPHRLVQLSDGTCDLADEIEFEESEVVLEREVFERVVHCDIVDGEKILEESVWEGEYIPIIPVIAQEKISMGKKRYVSAVRYSRDPQILINASGSSVADRLSTVNVAPFIGAVGSFKDRKWRDGKRHFYLEYAVQDGFGKELPPPQRNAFEPAIQGAIEATGQGVDALKRAVGYVDAVSSPSQQDLSGIALERRNGQKSLANIQYQDSLTDSMWHCGRVIVDLLLSLTDTPRVWDVRSESGETSKVPVTMDLPEGTETEATGYRGQPHVKIDDGDYGVVIYTGPGYDTKTEEGNEFLLKVVEMDPALLPIYLPAIFKRFGYEDLAEIAQAAQPPQIAQTIAAAQGKGIPPEVLQAQNAQLQQQAQQMKALLQQAVTALKTKQVETQGRIEVETVKNQGAIQKQRMELIGDIIKTIGDQGHDMAKHLSDKQHDAAGHMADLFHDRLDGMTQPQPGQQPAPEPLAA